MFDRKTRSTRQLSDSCLFDSLQSHKLSRFTVLIVFIADAARLSLTCKLVYVFCYTARTFIFVVTRATNTKQFEKRVHDENQTINTIVDI